MAEAIISTFRPAAGQPHPVEELRLIPSSGGRFEVSADGDLLYSKAATGQHTTPDHIIGLLRARLGQG